MEVRADDVTARRVGHPPAARVERARRHGHVAPGLRVDADGVAVADVDAVAVGAAPGVQMYPSVGVGRRDNVGEAGTRLRSRCGRGSGQSRRRREQDYYYGEHAAGRGVGLALSGSGPLKGPRLQLQYRCKVGLSCSHRAVLSLTGDLNQRPLALPKRLHATTLGVVVTKLGNKIAQRWRWRSRTMHGAMDVLVGVLTLLGAAQGLSNALAHTRPDQTRRAVTRSCSAFLFC